MPWPLLLSNCQISRRKQCQDRLTLYTSNTTVSSASIDKATTADRLHMYQATRSPFRHSLRLEETMLSIVAHHQIKVNVQSLSDMIERLKKIIHFLCTHTWEWSNLQGGGHELSKCLVVEGIPQRACKQRCVCLATQRSAQSTCLKAIKVATGSEDSTKSKFD